ncbi:MAG: ABC transporter ATP-binding protein [Desulfitobacteriaceae bacterium]|nr:ABC transporter ATP-binding protein [Desulfitobacteriaceae bacterium]MDD4583877.1 ABC transporter ATP-binding protein [Eubacteriales bacterium]
MSLSVHNICYRYPNHNKEILKGVSASFSPGIITTISGNNGCGKTTLVKIIIGMLNPTSGQVLLYGEDLSSWSIAQRGRKVGCVMQNPSNQIIGLTVREEMSYGLRNQGLSDEEINQKIHQYLTYFELGDYMDTFPLHLSLGERQRLMLAAFLAMEPSYIILDEPTASLDGYRKKLLGNYLKKTSDKGCGIILVSHDLSFIDTYGEKKLTLSNGILVPGKGNGS